MFIIKKRGGREGKSRQGSRPQHRGREQPTLTIHQSRHAPQHAQGRPQPWPAYGQPAGVGLRGTVRDSQTDTDRERHERQDRQTKSKSARLKESEGVFT